MLLIFFTLKREKERVCVECMFHYDVIERGGKRKRVCVRYVECMCVFKYSVQVPPQYFLLFNYRKLVKAIL